MLGAIRWGKAAPAEDGAVAPPGAGVAADDGEPDDAALVAAARRDPRAFAPLYERWFPPVYGYAYRRLGDPTAAEDAAALVFARALAALPSCRPDAFRPWLFAIAHNVLADTHRRARPTDPLDRAAGVRSPDPSPEAVAIANDESARLRAALAALPADQRRVVELRLAGLSGAEIAQTLGRRHATVRSLQHRAVGRLRALLDPDAPAEVPDAKP